RQHLLRGLVLGNQVARLDDVRELVLPLEELAQEEILALGPVAVVVLVPGAILEFLEDLGKQHRIRLEPLDAHVRAVDDRLAPEIEDGACRTRVRAEPRLDPALRGLVVARLALEIVESHGANRSARCGSRSGCRSSGSTPT